MAMTFHTEALHFETLKNGTTATLHSIFSFIFKTILPASLVWIILCWHLIFGYLPWAFVLCGEDIVVSLSKRKNFPVMSKAKDTTLQNVQQVWDRILKILKSIVMSLSNSLEVHTRKQTDSNALNVTFLRYCFSGIPSPVTIDPKEYQFAKIFLPLRLRIIGDIIRFFRPLSFVRMKPWNNMLTYLGRVHYIDDQFQRAITERNVRQIVFLGAGYDTRAYRFCDLRRHTTSDPNRAKFTTVYEIDRESVQQRKRSLMEKYIQAEDLKKMTENVVYLSCDFKDDNSLLNVLKKSKLQPNMNTLYILEGVSMYLTKSAFEGLISTLQVFRKMSSWSSVKHWLLFDIVIKESLSTMNACHAFNLDRAMSRYWAGKIEVAVSIDPNTTKNKLKNMGLLVEEEKTYVQLFLDLIENKDVGIPIPEEPSRIKYIYAEVK